MNRDLENVTAGLAIVSPVALLVRFGRPQSPVRTGLTGALLGTVAGGSALTVLVNTSDGFMEMSPDDRLEESMAAVMVGGVIGGYFGLLAALAFKAIRR